MARPNPDGDRRVMLIRHVFAVLAGLALATSSPASASPREQAAGSFLRRVVGDLAANRYDVAWRNLYSAQRAAIPRDHYVACERLTRVPAGHTVVEVLRVRSVHITVAGGPPHPVGAFAVRLRITITNPEGSASDTVVTTAHALASPSGWSWILSPKRFAADRRSDCGMAWQV
jgi:hypothetical protein